MYLLYSSWEYMITFARCKGDGRRWPGCKATRRAHSTTHGLSQARSSEGAVLASALPPKVCYGPPPHGYWRGLLAVFSWAHSSLGLLCCYGDAARLNKSRVGRDVSPWSILGSRCKQQLCSLPEGRINFICVTL